MSRLTVLIHPADVFIARTTPRSNRNSSLCESKRYSVSTSVGSAQGIETRSESGLFSSPEIASTQVPVNGNRVSADNFQFRGSFSHSTIISVSVAHCSTALSTPTSDVRSNWVTEGEPFHPLLRSLPLLISFVALSFFSTFIGGQAGRPDGRRVGNASPPGGLTFGGPKSSVGFVLWAFFCWGQ